MPEMTMTVRWPDGRVHEHYSPSLVLHDHLEPGATYPVVEFVGHAILALDIASQRVRDRYGFACTSAAASQQEIKTLARSFDPEATVTVLTMDPPLPVAATDGAPDA
jgi:uncharacterized repeat protein (TIGR04042 family)